MVLMKLSGHMFPHRNYGISNAAAAYWFTFSRFFQFRFQFKQFYVRCWFSYDKITLPKTMRWHMIVCLYIWFMRGCLFIIIAVWSKSRRKYTEHCMSFKKCTKKLYVLCTVCSKWRVKNCKSNLIHSKYQQDKKKSEKQQKQIIKHKSEWEEEKWLFVLCCVCLNLKQLEVNRAIPLNALSRSSLPVDCLFSYTFSFAFIRYSE